MIHHHNNRTEYLFVQVPEGTSEIVLDGSFIFYKTHLRDKWNYMKGFKTPRFTLWQLFGKVNELSEDIKAEFLPLLTLHNLQPETTVVLRKG